MTRHLKACREPESSAAQPTRECFHLMIEGRYNKTYWMHVAIPVETTLTRLDSFLRRIWLECCDHLSDFEIDGERFASQPMKEYGDAGMGARLSRILEVGTQFSYQYDFGSTTELNLKVLAVRDEVATRDPVHLLARNDPPQVACEQCGDRPATQICTECACQGQGWLCDACLAGHDCDPEMRLPVVNSPRAGVCGYTG